jgi:hypothetical protein
MTKEERIKKSLQLKFLVKGKLFLNLQIRNIAADSKLEDEEKEKQMFQLIEKLQASEIKENELRRNKYNSTFYKFEPFVGLNRQQRRSR